MSDLASSHAFLKYSGAASVSSIGSRDYSETAIQRKARLYSGAARKKRGFENDDTGSNAIDSNLL